MRSLLGMLVLLPLVVGCGGGGGGGDKTDDDSGVDICAEASACNGDFDFGFYDDVSLCKTISGNLRMVDVTHIEADLPCLTEVGGWVKIGHNEGDPGHNLASISLDSLTTIGKDLEIYGHYQPELSLMSFDSLTTIGKDLIIRDNTALTSVSLDSLTDVGGEVTIRDNRGLASFSLDSLTSAGDSIGISNNSSLCQSLVDTFLAAMEALGWSGEADTYGNADC